MVLLSIIRWDDDLLYGSPMRFYERRCNEPPCWGLNEDLGNGLGNLDPVNLLTSEIGSMT